LAGTALAVLKFGVCGYRLEKEYDANQSFFNEETLATGAPAE